MQVRTFHLPIGFLPFPYSQTEPHSALWRNPGARALLAHLLADQPLAPVAEIALDQVDYSMAGSPNVRIRATATDTDGTPLQDVQLRVRLRQGERTVPWRVHVGDRYLTQVSRDALADVGTGHRLAAHLERAGGGKSNEVSFRIA